MTDIILWILAVIGAIGLLMLAVIFVIQMDYYKRNNLKPKTPKFRIKLLFGMFFTPELHIETDVEPDEYDEMSKCFEDKLARGIIANTDGCRGWLSGNPNDHLEIDEICLSCIYYLKRKEKDETWAKRTIKPLVDKLKKDGKL